MGRSGENFLSVLDNDKISVFCAYDKDYNVYRAKIHRENLFKDYCKDIKECVFMNQIHSNQVENYDENLSHFSCDGLISVRKNTALCVLSADCLPLLLWNESGVIAALHSGRKGSFGNILKNCVDKIHFLYPNSYHYDFHLFISAGICAKNYEIDGEVLEFALKNFKDFVRDKKLDLKALVKAQARELGIKNIIDIGICSFENKNFFSYRREKSTQRFASVIVLKA